MYGTARVWSTPFTNWQALVDGAWPVVWSTATISQQEQLLLYLLDIKTAEWRQLKYLTQQIDYLRTQVLKLSLTPKQQSAWSFYLLSWLWQRLTWDDVESIAREQFEQTVISALGEVWQPVSPEKRQFWEQWSPNYYNHLLLEKLESVWNDWPLEQQVPLLIQLATLPPLVTNGSFERYEGWSGEDYTLINQIDNSVKNPYHGKQFLALGGKEDVNS